MSNKAGTVRINMTYKGPSAETAKLPEKSVAFAYMAQEHGTVDVPDTTAEDTAVEIPFGSVGDAATMILLQNRTGQDVEVKINNQNTGTHHHDLCDGGIFMIGGPSTVAANKIIEVSFTLSAAQSGPGEIEYHIFGDPV